MQRRVVIGVNDIHLHSGIKQQLYSHNHNHTQYVTVTDESRSVTCHSTQANTSHLKGSVRQSET